MNRVSTEVKASIESAPTVTGAPSIEAKAGGVSVLATDDASIYSFVDAPVLAVAASADKATGVDGRAQRLAQRGRDRPRRHDHRRPVRDGDRRQHHRLGDAELGDRRHLDRLGRHGRAQPREEPRVQRRRRDRRQQDRREHERDDPGRHDDRDRRCARAEHAADQGAITISATNSSIISATVRALAVAIGGGLSGTTPGIAIGFSIARNLIGWAEYGGVRPDRGPGPRASARA